MPRSPWAGLPRRTYGSPFTNMYAWWDFSALGLSNNASVTSVSDLSGNSRTLTPPASHNPVYKTSAVGPNLKDAVYGNYLNLLQYTLVSTLSQPFSIYIVWKTPLLSDSSIYPITTQSPYIPYMGINGTTSFLMNDGSTVSGAAGGAPALNTSYFQWANFMSGSNSSVYANSTTAKAGPSDDGSTGFVSGGGKRIEILGSATAQNVWISEVFMYARILSDSERTTLIEYVNSKYGFSIT